ncbi:MAG: ATP-binding protein [Schaedlerella sp.]|nr:ATP-binding protein [Schaedlerella sp.]
MLQNINTDKLHQIMNENKETKQIISQLLENHHAILSSITHEIRNPLTLISSSLQIIELKHPEVKEFSEWSFLNEDLHFLRMLLEELSSFNNGQTLHYSVFSLESFLKNIAVSFAISLESLNKSIEFSSHIPDSLGDFTGDKLKLEEVLLNLLRNAREAVDSNGCISLRAVRRKKAVIIQIEDNGCGILQEHLKTIFNPFITYKSGGTGLGLAISRNIIEAHKGTITVDSTPEKGSVFSIHLPL